MNNPHEQNRSSQQTGPQQAEPTWRSRIVQSLTLLAFSALFFVPLITYGCRGEIARWQAADALVKYQSDDRETAIEQLRAAVASHPEDALLTGTLAEILAKNDQAQQGVDLCNTWLEAHPDSKARINILSVKSECLQHLGRWTEALVTMKEVMSLLPQRSALEGIYRLNNLAYYRALADRELTSAQTDMNMIVDELAKRGYWPENRPLPFEVKTVIAASMILRELDQEESALPGLDKWIDRYEELIFIQDQQLVEKVYEMATLSFPFPVSVEKKGTETGRSELGKSTDALAFLLTVRGLIHQQLGNEKELQSDRIRVAEIGCDSAQLAEQLPVVATSLQILKDALVYLDTRGFVRLKLHDYIRAQVDLNLAILASETLERAIDSPLYNSIELSAEMPDNAAREKKLVESRKVHATLVYHRMLLYRDIGSKMQADQDAARIEAMGFDPETVLF